MQQVILITGASSGIGRATAERLISDGHCVYGSGRKDSELLDMKDNGIHPLKIEMTDDASMESAVKKVIKEQGRVDVLFNNAGYGLYGTVEETSIDDARHQFEVNLFGLARMTQLVMPHMRRQKSGKIINTSSMGGRIYTPLGAWYHATKHAVEGWSDCLRLELQQFGIDVVVIEPGGIQTQWGVIAADNIERISEKGPYKKYAKQVADGMRKRYEKQGSLSPPSVVASAVSKAVRSGHPKTRYVAGKYARTLMFARKYFGDRVFDKIISSSST